MSISKTGVKNNGNRDVPDSQKKRLCLDVKLTLENDFKFGKR